MNQNNNNQNGPGNNNGTQQNGGSPVGDSKPSTFFNYPVPAEEPRSSPSGGSNNVMMNGGNNLMNGANGVMNGMMNGLNNQQSNHSFHGMNMMNDEDGPDERQMDEPPSMEEINNMRSIPSVISPNGTTPVVMITNLNEDEIDNLFNLKKVMININKIYNRLELEI